MWAEGVRCWTLNKLEVPEGLEVNREILKGVGGLIDEKDIQNNVKLIDGSYTFAIDRIGVTSQLHYSAELRNEVIVNLSRASSTSNIQVELNVSTCPCNKVYTDSRHPRPRPPSC